MIVYIEGVDGSGKSTFAKAITNYLLEKNLNVYPNGEKLMVTHPWRLDRINKETLQYKLKGCLSSKTIYIVDRGELSDIIYRTFDIEKYSALMSLKEYYNLYQAYEYQYVIVHCDTEQSEKLMLARGEDNHISIVEHQRLRYLFNQIMPLFKAIRYDASKSMTNASYLTTICSSIHMELLVKGAINDVNKST